MSVSTVQKHIVIIGGGIIGCTSAYYLTRHPSFEPGVTSVTVLEASSVAGGASGKAGGLVAKWAYPKELVDVTFSEHEKLAKEHNGSARWGWRYTNVGQWIGRGEEVGQVREMTSKVSLQKKDRLHGDVKGSTKSKRGLPVDLDWVKDDLTDAYEPMAGKGETAQVHPYQFTTSMIELAQEKGAKLIIGKATNIEYSDITDGGKYRRVVSAVTYVDSSSGETRTIPASTVLVSAGPWTPSILPRVPISGTRAHSITIRPTRPVSAYALFTEITLPKSTSGRLGSSEASPEIYARPNSEVYACSPGDGEPLPASTKDVKVNTKVCDALFEQISSISEELRGGEVTAQQACYLPNVNAGPRGCPIVGEVEDTKGLVIAAGHTCWGICNAPGTGKVVSELIMDGKITSGQCSRLAPRMFM